MILKFLINSTCHFKLQRPIAFRYLDLTQTCRSPKYMQSNNLSPAVSLQYLPSFLTSHHIRFINSSPSHHLSPCRNFVSAPVEHRRRSLLLFLRPSDNTYRAPGRVSGGRSFVELETGSDQDGIFVGLIALCFFVLFFMVCADPQKI